ncbi:hypothetical protein COV06_01330 [Candidatus Uhrbacteria bacterium CG10_big_fil_rev_8_21_14_0_10_50_16]|uniref:Uncharacterized protein n=1 Tax=Candidatus Uhrbacteria bacterium CG10_big_fil_rev_8_21_14_0_10_50_16 TaxID=1975039 RepID=A0A2H0RPW6_9BACT|nr:MAG: hypothetical protein COV06_01330 [Candidatus Uhrbacteria bacterium CG10_big_fil_rev_8_21_14_0_10_50_16]
MIRSPWNACARCTTIPDRVSIDFLDKESEGIPATVRALPGMAGVDLSMGYQIWEMTCDVCGTRYQAEVDVEPMVWDFKLTRLQGDAK